jgi:hypothetical protein
MQRKKLGSWKEYSGREFSGFFSVDSDKFHWFPPGSVWKSSEKSGKFQAGILLLCSRYSPCFPAGSGDFPASFLQDPVAGTIALGFYNTTMAFIIFDGPVLISVISIVSAILLFMSLFIDDLTLMLCIECSVGVTSAIITCKSIFRLIVAMIEIHDKTLVAHRD